jgi:hypothetical protein
LGAAADDETVTRPGKCRKNELERSTMFHRKAHYFDWAIFSIAMLVKLPEGLAAPPTELMPNLAASVLSVETAGFFLRKNARKHRGRRSRSTMKG